MGKKYNKSVKIPGGTSVEFMMGVETKIDQVCDPKVYSKITFFSKVTFFHNFS